MMQLSSKNDDYHSIMTSSLRINISKLTIFFDFSIDMDYNISKTYVFRDVIYLIINQFQSRRLRRTQIVPSRTAFY